MHSQAGRTDFWVDHLQSASAEDLRRCDGGKRVGRRMWSELAYTALHDPTLVPAPAHYSVVHLLQSTFGEDWRRCDSDKGWRRHL